MRKSYKKLPVVMAVMIFTLSIASSVFAAGTFKNLKAFYNNIKIYKNGMQMPMAVEPFIIDGTTYVPLRAVSELLDKDVTWDQATYSVGINDKPGTSMNDLYTQIFNYQLTVAQLENKVKELEAQLSSKTSSITTISAMEKYLNNEYGTYKKIDFDFDLTESKSKVILEIYVNLDVDYSRWNNLSSTDRKEFLQNVVNDIDEAFPDRTISGFIEDSSRDKELISFTVNSKGNVVTDDTSGSSSTLSSLASYLNKNFYKIKYDKTYVSVNDIKLYGDKYDIEVVIYVDEDEFEVLYKSEIEDYLEVLYDEITDDFPSADVYGSIKDNGTIYEFDFDSRGYARLYK